MKVTIHNKELIGGNQENAKFEKAIKQHDAWFDKGSPKEAKRLDVYLDKKSEELKATFYLTNGVDQLFVEAEDANPVALAEKLMAKLRSRYLKEMIASRAKAKSHIPKGHMDQLASLKSGDQKEHFAVLIKQLLPSLRGFVGRYLSYSKIKVFNEFKIDDLVDEIYLALYARFDERPADPAAFSSWTFKIARETIDDFIGKYESNTGDISVEKLASDALRSMDEKFTADAGGDLIMDEDLDDVSYAREHERNKILDNQALIDNPVDPEINSVVIDVLRGEEETNRLAFELFWLHEMTDSEIAHALQMQMDEVEQVINSITDGIVSRLNLNP